MPHCEAIALLLCPIPYFDMIINIPAMDESMVGYVNCYYLLSDFTLVFMFVRVIFLVRAVINYSIFMDIYSKKMCMSFGIKANV